VGTAGARAGADGQLKPLSRMKKLELEAECTSRRLKATGTVSELRVRLRLSRQADQGIAP
jgi:hypothetical protein